MGKGIAAARGQRRQNTTQARQRFNTATLRYMPQGGINSQIGLLDGNNIEQDGKKALNRPFLRFSQETKGVVCPDPVRTRLWPFWWLFVL